MEYIKDEKGKVVTPLRISEDLQISYEVAHAIVLELIKEGRLEPVEDYDEGDPELIELISTNFLGKSFLFVNDQSFKGV
ncbi:hypothetical protein [Ferroglobus placidus]|uniref:hypothetical protein n=1 Tax=Ferroglobus placidus TaxID=54261 RepID=UPI0011D0840D|nr:hypothetical protein [Ferroglobus placidus]